MSVTRSSEMAGDEVAGLELAQDAAARSSGAGTSGPSGTQSGQRGWKRQPLGGAARSGGEPGMPTRRCSGPVSGGNDSMSPRVYGCSGLRAAARAGAGSTISPAYMIAIRSANSMQQREVVRDEEHREAEVALQILDLLEDLALHDDVERGRRLVHDQELGLERERHRDDHALAHAAGELVRDTRARGAGRCRRARAAPRRARARALRDALVRLHHVDELVADAHHGVERVHRALEDHRDVPPAVRRSSFALLPTRSSPRKRMLPPATCAGGRRICMIAFATVVLPQPDSPASPTTSPAWIVRSMPSTARTRARRRRTRPASPRSSMSALALVEPSRSRRHRLERPRHAGGRPRASRALSDRSTRSRGLLTSSMPASRSVSAEHGDADREAGEDERPPLALEHARVDGRPVERDAPARLRACRRARGTRDRRRRGSRCRRRARTRPRCG